MPVHDDVFAALANPARREVLRLLLDGPMAAGQLAERFDMRRPSLSEHLRVLREAGLVAEQRQGRNRVYSLDAGPLEEVSAWLTPYERFWRAKLANLRDLLDEEDL
ncbi:metalloregulator ArsR/SmtB family transcription factor [Amycolatopsis sp. NPDC058986]|uniref:metalloregulator ArsR/SmtB family transcription factor n=1 Tax=unclassified Amycolatopsis TaxID=2618356 RepID=UPI00366CFE6B